MPTIRASPLLRRPRPRDAPPRWQLGGLRAAAAGASARTSRRPAHSSGAHVPLKQSRSGLSVLWPRVTP